MKNGNVNVRLNEKACLEGRKMPPTHAMESIKDIN